MRELKHTNVVELKSYYQNNGEGDKIDEKYLFLVLEFVPETIYRIIKHYNRSKRQVPILYVKVRFGMHRTHLPCIPA